MSTPFRILTHSTKLRARGMGKRGAGIYTWDLPFAMGRISHHLKASRGY
jgi:hypothetical protein